MHAVFIDPVGLLHLLGIFKRHAHFREDIPAAAAGRRGEGNIDVDHRLLIVETEIFQFFRQRVQVGFKVVKVELLRDQHGELVGRYPVHFFPARYLLDGFRHLLEDEIADDKTVKVVDQLEVVDVELDEGALFALVQIVPEPVEVGQVRQRIDKKALDQLLFALLKIVPQSAVVAVKPVKHQIVQTRSLFSG